MSIIQRIRDKAAWLIFAAIALAMIGFIVTDAFQGGGGGGLFNSRSTTIGKVNGEKIDYAVYSNRLKEIEERSGGGMNDMMRERMQGQLWDQMVEESLLKDVFDDLGLYISDKEVSDIMYGANPPENLRQQFTNPQTGQYDATKAYQEIEGFRKKNPKQYDEFVLSLIYMRQREKYLSLLTNTVYVPKWMVEKSNADGSQLTNISFVNVPYSSIPDSAVKVTDADIQDYISKHTDDFKQEETRGIAYVAFNAGPSAEDTASIRELLLNVKPEFDTTTDYQSFLARNGSETSFSDEFVTKYNLQIPGYADTIANLSEGQVLGPYQDGGALVLAKMIAKRSMPDSIKVRHILISTQSTPDSIAKVRIDSVQRAIAGGADFKALTAAVSEDPGSKDKGGEYDFSSMQTNLAPEFYDAVFFGNKGDKKVVKTSLGYHYLEVLDQKKVGPAYKVAYLMKSIVPSTVTTNQASGLASQFSGQSRNQKAFDENVTKNKLQKIISSDITPAATGIPNLGFNRQLVRWVYEADLGDVSEPFAVDDRYIVAVVTEINKAGTMKPEKARPMIEVLVRNKKKAAQLAQKIGKPVSLEAVASANAQAVRQADSLSFAASFIPNTGQEPKVVGAAFNKALQGKVSEPIAGNGGVYVIQPGQVYAKANAAADVEQQRLFAQMQLRSSIANRAIEALKKAASIKDNSCQEGHS